MADRLLPPNASELERALEQVTARLGEVSVPLRSLWNPQTCPAEILPWLAWSLSVDEWDSSWPEATKREVIARAIALHRKKGTPWAIKEALKQVGFEVEIIDQTAQRAIYAPFMPLKIDGSWRLDGAHTIRPIERLAAVPQIQHWAQFIARVNLADARDADGLALARRLIDKWKPVSRHQIFLLWLLLVADFGTVMGAQHQLRARLPSTRLYPWCNASLSTYPDAVWRLGRDGEPLRLPQPFGAFRVGERRGAVAGLRLRACRAATALWARLPTLSARMPRERLRLDHNTAQPARLTVSGYWRLGQSLSPEISIERIA